MLATASGCAPGLGGGGEPRYRVQQSARVLPPVPGVRSGAPMAATTEVAATTGVVTVADPHDEDSGNRISRTWIDAAVRRRVTPHVDIAALAEAAPASPSIQSSDSDMLPVARDIPFAFGAGVRRTFGDGRGFDVGVGLDLLIHSVPAAQQSRCAAAYCTPEEYPWRPWTGRTAAGMGRLSVVPTWVGERVSWFAGASLRNVHWVRRDQVVIGGQNAADLEGGWDAVLAAGTDVALGDRVRLLATVAQPLGDPGADFGPLVSIGLAARVGAATGGSP